MTSSESLTSPLMSLTPADQDLEPAQFPVSATPPQVRVPTTDRPGDGGGTTNADMPGDRPGDYVSVWGPCVRLIGGVGIVVLGLWWSLHFTSWFDLVGYIPTMFAYLVVMIIGGALMVAGATTLWTRLTTLTDTDQGR